MFLRFTPTAPEWLQLVAGCHGAELAGDTPRLGSVVGGLTTARR